MEKIKIRSNAKKPAPTTLRSLHYHFDAIDYPISPVDIKNALRFKCKTVPLQRSRKKLGEKQFLIGLFSAAITLIIISQVIPR